MKPSKKDQSLLNTPSSTKQNQPPLSDLDLVKKTLENRENFQYIMERYEPKLLRYLIYFTGQSREASEDILQEAFLKVYRNLNGFRQNLSFSSWVYRIVHNEAINYLKKNKQKQKVVSLDAEDEQSFSLMNILASEENIMLDLKAKETSAKVREILKEIRDDYREVLVLKYLEDYSYDEISDILKKPLGTIGVLISRAKSNFKEIAKQHNLLNHE